MQPDCVFHFLDKYCRGEILAALQVILPAPNVCYDTLPTNNKPLLKVIANYVDASVFNTQYFITELTLIHLQNTLKKHPEYAAYFPTAQHLLNFEITFLRYIQNPDYAAEKDLHLIPLQPFMRSKELNIPLEKEEIDQILILFPDIYRSMIAAQIALSQAWIRFKKARPEFEKLINTNLPWYPFHYPVFNAPDVHSSQDQGETPIIFPELYNNENSVLFNNVTETASIFVFENQAAFMQALRFPNVEKALSNPKHLIYILELYPNEQLLAQSCRNQPWQTFKPILYSRKFPLLEGLSVFCKALQECLAQTEEQLNKDTPCADWLYHISKRIVYKIKEERLGMSRAAALLSSSNLRKWYESHHGLPPPNVSLGPEPHDYFGQKLQQIAMNRKPRLFKPRKKIKLAHIVSQVIEGGHAPTRLLETLLTHYDRDKYEVILISSEILQFHPEEYPYNLLYSFSSKMRAPNLLKKFQEDGIKVYIADTTHTFEETGMMIASILYNQEIDIAVFHAPQEIHLMAAQITDAPLRVLFEHGTHSTYPGFDIEIVSTFESLELHQDLFKRLNIKPHALPFAVDVCSDWPKAAPLRSQFGLPEEGFLMTTISNNLDSRLSSEMCLAIVEILQRCPNAYYTPMGKLTNSITFYDFFKKHGVIDQVIFMGQQSRPGHVARMMSLYLNEFPVGSGLGILDAMASGCPVVTMYDEFGPQQARYGGIYFGLDHAVRSGQRKDYVELACRLIKDKDFYKEWSLHSLKQYEKFSNLKEYVAKFEKILESCLKATT